MYTYTHLLNSYMYAYIHIAKFWKIFSNENQTPGKKINNIFYMSNILHKKIYSSVKCFTSKQTGPKCSQKFKCNAL